MDNKLKELKKIYHSEEIPEELRARSNQAFQKGFIFHKKKNLQMKWLTATLSVAAAFSLFVLTVNLQPAFASQLEEIPVLKGLVNLVQMDKVTLKDQNVVAEINIPEILGLTNEEYEEKINAEIRGILEGALKKTQESRNSLPKSSDEQPIPAYLSSSFEILSKGDIFSFKIITTEIQAIGYEQEYFFNIDLNTNEKIQLKDLFSKERDYVQVISDEIEKQIDAQMKADEGMVYFTEMSTFEKIKPDQSFYINPKGKLVIAFEKYSIAPGYMGTPEFEIPTNVIREILKEHSPIH